jgi:hypothetical protein
VESGEILDSYPQAQGRNVIVMVASKHQPDPAGLLFFDRVRIALARAGFQFQWNQFSPVYEN